MNSSGVSLTEGSIKKGILKFAFPLFLGNLFQQCYNVVDSIVVGNYVGKSALAAVTSTGILIFLLVGFYTGMFMGVGVVISRYFGAKDKTHTERAVGTAVSFGIISGVLLTITGVIFAPWILKLMDTPADVFDEALIYVRTYFIGSIFVILYNTANGIFNAVGDSKRPLYYLIISSIVNVVLDLFFVTVLKWGVFGVALATVIAQAVSVVTAFTRLMRIKEVYAVTPKTICIDRHILSQMIRIGLPSGLQNSVIAIANTFVQSSVNLFGSSIMAGNGAYTKIEGFVFIPITAFTMAITTFVSQNIGAGKIDRVKKGVKFAILFSCITAEAIGILFVLIAPQLIAIFGNEPDIIKGGILRAYIDAGFYFLLSFSHCIASVMRGAGKSKVPMFIMLICWCAIRITYIKIALHFCMDIRVIYWAYPLTWFLSSLMFLIYYVKADWLAKADLDNNKNKSLVNL